MNVDKIAKFIKELRIENNYSQNSLSEELHVTRQAISNWETGKAIPDSDILLKISNMFNVSINEILSGERTTSENNLETIALDLLDDNNKKKNKIKKIMITFSLSLILLITMFLGYYFISTYNSIKIYKIYGNSNLFKTYNGVLMTTKNKSYLRIHDILPVNEDFDYNINYIKLYYIGKNNKKVLLSKVKDNNIIINDYSGYNEFNIRKNKKYIFKNLYLEIYYDNNKCDLVHLNLQEDFSNNLDTLNQDSKLTVKREKELKKINKNEPVINELIESEIEKTNVYDLVRKEITNQEVKSETNNISEKQTNDQNTTIIPNNNYEINNEEIIKDEENNNLNSGFTSSNNEEINLDEIIELLKIHGTEEYGMYQYEMIDDNKQIILSYGYDTLSLDIVYDDIIENYQVLYNELFIYSKYEKGNETENDSFNINIIENHQTNSYINFINKLQKFKNQV